MHHPPLRIADEFCCYHRSASSFDKPRCPAVLFIDNLHFTAKNLWDVLDLRVGRQDMACGAKRFISDGTGGDGSRSACFDASRPAWHSDEKSGFDAFSLYHSEVLGNKWKVDFVLQSVA